MCNMKEEPKTPSFGNIFKRRHSNITLFECPDQISPIPISSLTDGYIEKLQEENMELKRKNQEFAEKNSRLTKKHDSNKFKLLNMEYKLAMLGTECTKLQKHKVEAERLIAIAYYLGGRHAFLAIKDMDPRQALLAIENMELQDPRQALLAIENMELQNLEQKFENVKARTGIDKESFHHNRSDQSRSQFVKEHVASREKDGETTTKAVKEHVTTREKDGETTTKGGENIKLNNIASLETKNSKKRNRKKALGIRKSSYKMAMNIQKIKKLHVRRDNNLCEDTCNGAEYLNFRLEGTRPDDFDDLADFLVCQKEKDYPKWFIDRESCRSKYQNKAARKRERKKKILTCVNGIHAC
ncbi:hypothetical protein AQUCO_03000115v1 [Aquilegia coerulea]|uniref:Uncharacterized protein n=1 Tax=Aquilegia coerulea TaxID=218851 RepID=A0A2G5D1A9_AQUCA|nr:hypothetical protein AQUCO_03000115v1 [Aquilegia coerulea]